MLRLDTRTQITFLKYLVSARAITRLAHAVYLPDAFVRGAFSSAKTAIETS